MAYSEDLVEQVRAQLSHLDVTERTVMSGIGFFIDDRLAVAVLDDGLCLRVEGTGDSSLRPLEFAGREVQGWVCIPESHLDQARIARWVGHGVAGLELPV